MFIFRRSLLVVLFPAFFCLFHFTSSAQAAEPPATPTTAPAMAEPLGSLDNLFKRTSGWTGADGASSVPLSENLTLWLYGDTWIGRVYDGARTRTTMINNSIALQALLPQKDGSVACSRPRFFWKTVRAEKQKPRMWLGETPTADRSAEKPTSFFLPPDGKGWFWPLHGMLANRTLLVFLLQLDKTDETSVFGFRTVGLWLARVSNPFSQPSSWVISYRRVPWSLTEKERQITFGSAVWRDGDDIYVYGIDENLAPGQAMKRLILARTQAGNLDRFNTWRFWNGTDWGIDFEKAAPLADGLVDEFSVCKAPDNDELVLIQTEAGLSPRIMKRTAPAPQGPWSSPMPLFTVSETCGSKRLFSYAAKAHPELSQRKGELILTYVINSFDFFDLVKQARLYWPLFLKVQTR